MIQYFLSTIFFYLSRHYHVKYFLKKKVFGSEKLRQPGYIKYFSRGGFHDVSENSRHFSSFIIVAIVRTQITEMFFYLFADLNPNDISCETDFFFFEYLIKIFDIMLMEALVYVSKCF